MNNRLNIDGIERWVGMRVDDNRIEEQQWRRGESVLNETEREMTTQSSDWILKERHADTQTISAKKANQMKNELSNKMVKQHPSETDSIKGIRAAFVRKWFVCQYAINILFNFYVRKRRNQRTSERAYATTIFSGKCHGECIANEDY